MDENCILEWRDINKEYPDGMWLYWIYTYSFDNERVVNLAFFFDGDGFRWPSGEPVLCKITHFKPYIVGEGIPYPPQVSDETTIEFCKEHLLDIQFLIEQFEKVNSRSEWTRELKFIVDEKIKGKKKSCNSIRGF